MLCRVQLNFMQRFCKRAQNHQVYLNVMLSVAEFYAKVVLNFYICKLFMFGLLAKVAIDQCYTSLIRMRTRALGLFQLSKCRSVYLLSINQLDLFYSDMKLRKSVCKTLAIFFTYCDAFNSCYAKFLRKNSCVPSLKRLRFIVTTFLFLRYNVYVSSIKRK